MHTYNEQVKQVPTGNSTSDTQWDNMQHMTNNNISQGRIAVKNGQKGQYKWHAHFIVALKSQMQTLPHKWDMEGLLESQTG